MRSIEVVRMRWPSRSSRQRRLTCRSEEHTPELQSPCNLVCRLLLETKNGGARAVRLGDDDDRGEFHDAAFDALEGVAPTRRNQEDQQVNQLFRTRLAPAQSHRLYGD